MYQEKYNLPKLFEETTRALRSFLWSDEFFSFAIRIAKMVELPPEKDIDLISFLQVLALRGFPVEEAEERLNDFLPDLDIEKKEIIIREIALGLLPSLENLWKITSEEENYNEKVQRYLSMMNFYLKRPPIVKKPEETRTIQEETKEERVENKEETGTVQKEMTEPHQEFLPPKEEIVTINWEENREENREEAEGVESSVNSVWNIPKIDFKIKQEKTKEEEESGPIDLSQI